MLIQNPKLISITILILSLIFLSQASGQDSIYMLYEGDSIEIAQGYYLNVVDIDTYYYEVTFSLTKNSEEVLYHTYNLESEFYYDDSYLTLSFDIENIFAGTSGNVIKISNVYQYIIPINYGTISIYNEPAYVDVYLDGEYQGENTGYMWIDNINEGYHEVELVKYGYYTITEDIYVYAGETTYYEKYLEAVDETATSDDYYVDNGGEDFFVAVLGFIFLAAIILIPLFFLLILVLLFRKKNSRKIALKTEPQQAAPQSPAPPASQLKLGEGSVGVKSAFEYRGAVIHYKVKVENHSPEPIGDIKFTLFIPDVFFMKDRERSISMLEPGEGKTVTFEIRPTGECGDCMVSGSINYYDYSTKKRTKMDMENKMVSIVCPLLTRKETDEKAWRERVNKMIIAEEDSKDLEIPAENLFDISTRVLKDMNLFMLQPETTSTPRLFTSVARFYAEGVTGLQYAAYVEVVGKRKSRLILKAWAEKEEALIGFYHKMLEEIEKKTDIKIFVDDSITQYNIRSTTIKDSVVQRSNIETGMDEGERSCPNCGSAVEEGGKFCMECGERLINS